MAKIKTRRALAATAAALVTLALFAVDTLGRHAHELAEHNLTAHEHFLSPGAVGQKPCGDSVHLDLAFAQRHDACLGASHRTRPPGYQLVAGVSLLPDPARLERSQPGLTRRPPAGLPEGRAPPFS